MEPANLQNRRDVANRIRSLREDNDLTVEDIILILGDLKGKRLVDLSRRRSMPRVRAATWTLPSPSSTSAPRSLA